MARHPVPENEEIQKFGPGIDEQGNPYDELLISGKTKVYFIHPKITKEENERRLAEVGHVLSHIYGCEVTVRYSKKALNGRKIALK